MAKYISTKGVPFLAVPLFFMVLLLSNPLVAAEEFDPILKDDVHLPAKEVQKIRQMGDELYKKTGVAVFVALVDDLNTTKPIELIERVNSSYPSHILLFFSMHPLSVNIFTTPDTKPLIDADQILSPLPWRGTIKPVMSPAFSKDENVKIEVAVLNGYGDIVDQVADAKGVKLSSSIGSGSKSSFLIVRWIFYGIIAFIILQYFYYKRKRRG
jgi:hypothetical protein